MILWTIRQMLSLRQAVLGRARPSELAWGLALGIAIGIVPKGNLVSVLLIGLLISLRVNHGMAALAAVSFSFLSVWLDPWTHQLGAVMLGAERVQSLLERIWNWPLMPWTELNNTIVMGSTVAAGLAVIPTYAASVPVFRWLAPRADLPDATFDPPPTDPSADAAAVAAAESGEKRQLANTEVAGDTDDGLVDVDAPLAPLALGSTDEAGGRVETRIDVIRLKPLVESDPSAGENELPVSNGQMNEALGYLLRRLRDSKQGKAA